MAKRLFFVYSIQFLCFTPSSERKKHKQGVKNFFRKLIACRDGAVKCRVNKKARMKAHEDLPYCANMVEKKKTALNVHMYIYM